MIRAILIFAVTQAVQFVAFAQSSNVVSTPQPDSGCPVEVVKMNPSHESFWNNMATTRTYGNTTVNDHNKFLEVKVKNNSGKTIRGIKFVAAYYDATEDLNTIPTTWGLHSEVKPGEVGTGNWNTNRYQKEASIGWVILPWKILYTDGSKWQQSGIDCMYESWKNKQHPRVNKAPNLNGLKLEGE
jgi:hypothetical protein